MPQVGINFVFDPRAFPGLAALAVLRNKTIQTYTKKIEKQRQFSGSCRSSYYRVTQLLSCTEVSRTRDHRELLRSELPGGEALEVHTQNRPAKSYGLRTYGIRCA